MRSVRSTAALAITSVVFWAMPIAIALPAAAQSGLQDIVASHEGASDQVQLLRDTTVPEIQITSPLDDSVIAGNAVTVSGTAADLLPTLPPEATPLFGEVFWSVEDESFVTIGSGTAPIVDGRFTIPDIVLGTGRHSIIVQALDSAGNGEPDAVSLTSDPDAPLVALVGIADGEAVLTSSVAVDLNFAAPTILVSVNGVADGRSFPAGLAPDALALPLAVGPNPVTLELDAGSGPFLFSFTIFRVESAGPIRILAPAEGSLTNQVEATVTGTVPRGTPFVTVNGAPATLEPDGVTFTAPLALAEGGNEIRAQAFPFGQEDSVRVTLDTVPPALELLFPEDGTLTGDAEVAFAGFVSEAGRVEAMGPGGAAAAATQTRVLAPGNELFGIQPILEFVFELPLLALVDGPNPIDLRLVDRAGNESLVPLTLRRSSAALVLESPAAGSALPDLRTDLVLQVLEDVTLEALFSAGRRVPGFAGIALSAGALPPATATLSGVPLAPGTTELRLVYRRDATGEREVLSFALESLATEVATVAGIVTDSQTGSPLEGALVSVVVNGLELVVPSGPDGRFALPVEPGDVQVVVRREGFVDLVVEGMPGAGETFVADANLIPWSVGGSPAPGDPTDEPTSAVAGTVTELPTEEPLEGALVVVRQGAFQRSAITEAPGTYAIGEIPVGDFEVTITRVGFFPQVFTVEAAEPVVAPLDVALEPIPDSVTLVGTTISELSGLREAGVEVKVLGTELVATTDAAGEFVLTDVPLGAQTLRFRKGGFAESYFTFGDLAPLPEGRPVERTFAYPIEHESGRPIAVSTDARGRVLDLFTRQPLPGAEVEVDGQIVVADAEGRFVVPDLTPFELFEFTATAPGHTPQTIEALVVVNGEEELGFDLRPITSGFLSGTVTDAATGAPIPKARARVAGSDRLLGSTGSDGTYGIVSIPSGTYTVAFSHPEYVPAEVSGVSVEDRVESTVDVALVPRPRTGGLTGTVVDAITGAPIAGATLSHPAGGSSTTDADGSYLLTGLPSGLVRLSIEAPGFPATTRTAAVEADREPGAPTLTVADFALAQDPAEPTAATAVVSAAEGGSLELPGGRLRLDIPPASLTSDAEVTLRVAPAGEAGQGDPLVVDPELGVGSVVAVGSELEILVGPVADGDPLPNLVGPALLTLRYAAEDAAAAAVAEETLFPYYFDGGQWTALQILPHLHAVDRIDRIVLAGLQFAATETGDPVLAGLATERPVLVAGGVDIPGFGVVRRFVLHLAGKLRDFVDPPPEAAVRDLRDVASTRDLIHPNGLPLLVFHGWDPKNLVFNSEPNLDVLDDPGSRYRQMLLDLLDGTNGVYRPIFVSYNTRDDLWDTSNTIALLLNGEFQSDGIRGIPSASDPDSGRFASINSFGFSMGGLAERTYQCRTRRARDLVAMGSPHVGALDHLQKWLTARGVLESFLVGFLRRLSPGTAQLLDYDHEAPSADASANPFLWKLNRDKCSAPVRGASLIAGNDPISLLGGAGDLLESWIESAIQAGLLDPSARDDLDAVAAALSAGNLAVGAPSDGVVPVTSALAKTDGGRRVEALDTVPKRLERTEGFTHFNVGFAGGVQISTFMDDAILPMFSDWVVERGTLEVALPTASGEGFVRGDFTVEFNVPHGDVTGVVPVVYVLDATETWRIVSGADPGSRAPDSNDVRQLHGNSKVEGNELLDFNVQLPKEIPGDPTTDIQDTGVLFVRVGPAVKEVPPDPTKAGFGVPGP